MGRKMFEFQSFLSLFLFTKCPLLKPHDRGRGKIIKVSEKAKPHKQTNEKKVQICVLQNQKSQFSFATRLFLIELLFNQISAAFAHKVFNTHEKEYWLKRKIFIEKFTHELYKL